MVVLKELLSPSTRVSLDMLKVHIKRAESMTHVVLSNENKDQHGLVPVYWGNYASCLSFCKKLSLMVKPDSFVAPVSNKAISTHWLSQWAS